MSYGGNIYTSVSPSLVVVAAPISTTLMNFVGIDDPNWLKSAISDGTNASQAVTTSTLTALGPTTFTGNVTLQGTAVESTATLTWTSPTDFSIGASFNGTFTPSGIGLGRMHAVLMAIGY